MTRSQVKLLFLSSIGGALEFYDFVIYALFASYISFAFFPQTDPVASLINTYAVFAVGYIGRPIGSIVFGHLGDRYGRKYAFTIAAFLMASSTFLIGLLPTYQQIGLPATFLLILLRIMQGISLGGEIGGVTVFVTEHVAAHKRGLTSGLIFMAIAFGNVLGSLVGFILTHTLSESNLLAWGWRIPFWIGFILGIVAYLIRKKTIETPIFSALQENKKYRYPFIALVRFSFPQILIGISLTALPGVTFALLMYVPNYMSVVFNYSAQNTFSNNIIAFLLVSVFSAVFGWISDYIGRKQLIMIASLLTLFFAYYLFDSLITTHNILIFDMGIAFLAAMTNGCYACAIAEQFKTEIRYTGLAFSLNVGITIFAAITPVASMMLFNLTRDFSAPIYFLAVCAGINLIGAMLLKRTQLRYIEPAMDSAVSS